MDVERWKQVEALFHAAVELPLAERATLLAARCGEDRELRALVERLLRDDERGGGELDSPALEEAGPRVDPLIGRVLGAWRLVARIGVGGMGVVYRAERADGVFDLAVAVKLLRPGVASAEALRRFDQERRTLAALTHPNIAHLYDGGATPDGNPYLVMELVRGVPIDAYCDAQRLSVEARVRLFVQVCQAVHFAHTNLVVHRDLKPGNVLVDETGVPKLVDFGIARLIASDEEGASPASATLLRALTPEYASPEQIAGGSLTTSTDVYSLGVVLYALLTGKCPFRMTISSPIAWMRLVSERAPTRPSTAVVQRGEARPLVGPADPDPADFAARCGTTPRRLRARLAGDLDRIVLMALRKEPERRYASARAFADDLERHLAGLPVAAREDSAVYRLSKFARRNRIAVGAGVAVAATLVAGTIAARRGEQRAAREAEHARVEALSFRSIADFLMSDFLAAEDYADAERRGAAEAKILRQAERVRRQFEGDAHQRANLIDALGRVCLRLEQFDSAEALIREAYEVRRAHFGEPTLEVALSLASLGELEYRRGDYGAAAEHMTRVLELHRASREGTHTDVATAANDLAVALRNLGDVDGAERLHEEALALRRAAEDGGLAVAESLNNLGGVHLDRAQYERAVECLSEALAIRARILGPVHELTLQSVSNLANASWHAGARERARELYLAAERELRALHGQGRAGLVSVLGGLAALDLFAGELDAAQARLDEALALRTAALGPDHPSLAPLLTTSARVCTARGDRAAARAHWDAALRVLRARLTPDHPALARALREHSWFLLEGGERDAARSAALEALELLEHAPPHLAGERGRAEFALGLCLRADGELAEAELHFRAALEQLEGAPGVSAGELELVRRKLEQLEGGAAAETK